VYYYCPALKGRNYLLLVVSLLFYAWGKPRYVLVMLLSICFNYRMGLCAADATLSLSVRKVVLAAAIAGNLLVLFYFKYLGFALVVTRSCSRLFTLKPPPLVSGRHCREFQASYVLRSVSHYLNTQSAVF